MHQCYSDAMTEYLEVVRDPETGCKNTVSVHMSYQLSLETIMLITGTLTFYLSSHLVHGCIK